MRVRDSREIIEEFQTCEWRETKFDLIASLSHVFSRRAFEFLSHLALDTSDLPMAEAAIEALGQSRARLASRFLVLYFETAVDSLKASIVGALGYAGDRAAAPILLKSLGTALKLPESILARNLILTLGELKESRAIPFFLAGLESSNEAMRTACLLSLGRVSRTPQDLDRFEPIFKKDLLKFHMFQQARAQIRFRQEWKLEDYLKKLFEAESYHPLLPLELALFSPEDVILAFGIFDQESFLDRKLDALRGLTAEWVFPFLESLVSISNGPVSEERLIQVLRAASYLDSDLALPLLEKTRDRIFAAADPRALQTWLDALVLGTQTGEKLLKQLIEAESFDRLPEVQQILVLNALVEYGLVHQSHRAQFLELHKLLDAFLGRFLEPAPGPSIRVQARALRGFAQWGENSVKAGLCVESAGEVEELRSSVLAYLEAVPQKSGGGFLRKALDAMLKAPAEDSIEPELFLRALRALPHLDAELKSAVEPFLKNLLLKGEPPEKIAAARVLSRHAISTLVVPLQGLLSAKQPAEVRLAAVVALRTSKDEKIADSLADLVELSDRALRGRALDTLSALPGMRAKRLLVDFLAAHIDDDADSVQKICRALKSPEQGQDYFIEVLNRLIQKHPDHPQSESLLDLRDRFVQGKTESTTLPKLKKKPDVEALDQELGQRISGYPAMDEPAKMALRSAEMIVNHPEIFDDYVDKSSAIVAYSKAVDLYLERHLGKKHLFPKLERHLNEFQNVFYAAGLAERDPRAQSVLEYLGLKGKILESAFPLHKMGIVAQGFLNGRILHDQFKVLDGLRAWAVILLIFPRVKKPLISLPQATDDQLIGAAKRLMALQDIRNPAAHRQTVMDTTMLMQIRKDALDLLSLFQKIL